MNKRLKNWITIFKSLKNGKKGLLTYLNYLHNDNHSNHLKNGHKIINIHNNSWQNVFSNIVSKIQKRETEKILRGKGGRTASKYGQSITLNIPHILEDKNLKDIADKIVFEFYKQIHSKEKLFYKKGEWSKFKNDLLYYNVHQQPSGSKTQFNFILSEHIGDKKLDLSQKKYSYLFKTISSEILKEYGYDINNYTIQKTHKQNNNTKIYKQNKLDNLLDNVEKQKQTLKQQIEQINTNTNETIKKLEKRVSTYLLRMDTAIEEQNQDKFDKNKLLVDKNIEKLKQSLITTTKTDTVLASPNISQFEKIKKELEKSYNTSITPTLGR